MYLAAEPIKTYWRAGILQGPTFCHLHDVKAGRLSLYSLLSFFAIDDRFDQQRY
jgi:hypothetical protein